jgi:SAM-dependent methyltransferase
LSLNSTDKAWEAWGQKDPYFGVITDPRFRKENLTPEAKHEFFESGRGHVNTILAVIRTFVAPEFVPKRVVDFGCGVGRLVLPFARMVDSVVGIDISEAMLAEAKRNCAAEGLTNATFIKSDDELSELNGSFDLIHSCLVFQHIPVQRGRLILRKILSHLEQGGVGVVDFTYGKSHFADSFGVPPPPDPKQSTAPIPGGDPEMQMNAYNLSEIFFLLKEAGVTRMHTEFLDHGGEQAILLFFQKPLIPSA